MNSPSKAQKKNGLPRRTLLVLLLVGFGLVSALWMGYLRNSNRSNPKIAFSPFPEPVDRSPKISSETPKNVIIFVADGFGFSHLSLALLTASETTAWPQFSTRGWHAPHPHWGPITDSAAAATALATGQLTRNGRVGVDPEGVALTNLFERASELGYRTGIVTDSYIWDATPASFFAHTESRENAELILRQSTESNLEILFGELEDVGEDEVPEWEPTVRLLETRFQLLEENLLVPDAIARDQPLAVVFPEDHVQNLDSKPRLDQLTDLALDRLSNGDQGFLLLVESEEMDSAGHQHDTGRTLKGLESIRKTLQDLLRFTRSRDDTLLVFTSDHDTGGLTVSYQESTYPDLKLLWTTRDHTAAVVPLFAEGPGAEPFGEIHRIWEVGQLLHQMIR